MDIKFAKDVIDEKMATVTQHQQALYGAINAIPVKKIDETMTPEVMQLQKEINHCHALLTVVVDSLCSSIELAKDDAAEFFQSWDR